jgi:hypothetical protein
MLLNYTEFVLVLTPARYSPYGPTFAQDLYKVPRNRGREIREWLVNNFRLVHPPASDEYTNETRLKSLLLEFLARQGHTLYDSLQRSEEQAEEDEEHERELLPPIFINGDKDENISATQVRKAIEHDLYSLPEFQSYWEKELEGPAPTTYCWPAAPRSSKYVVERIT